MNNSFRVIYPDKILNRLVDENDDLTNESIAKNQNSNGKTLNKLYNSVKDHKNVSDQKTMKSIAKLPGLKLLLFKDGEEYVAHILDFDLVGTGATREEALKEVSDSATAQIAYALGHNRVRELLHPAPQEFYEKWKFSDTRCFY